MWVAVSRHYFEWVLVILRTWGWVGHYLGSMRLSGGVWGIILGGLGVNGTLFCAGAGWMGMSGGGWSGCTIWECPFIVHLLICCIKNQICSIACKTIVAFTPPTLFTLIYTNPTGYLPDHKSDFLKPWLKYINDAFTGTGILDEQECYLLGDLKSDSHFAFLFSYNMNDNPKNNILKLGNIRQKWLTILEYFDAYICHRLGW